MPSVGLPFNRSAQLIPFLRRFERHGGDVEAMLEATGLDKADVWNPTSLVTGNALYRAVQTMSDTLGDPFFGARAAEEFIEAGPIFARESYAASHTLAEFLPMAIVETSRQISTINFSLSISAETTVIYAKRSFLPTVPVTQADAASATIWVALLRGVAKDKFDATRMTAVVQKREGIPHDILPASSVISRKWNGISVAFPSSWLALPLNLDWQFPPAPRGEFRAETIRDDVVTALSRICLARIGDKSFGIEQLAESVGANPRSLQRSLKNFGTSFQDIRDEVRRERSIELVSSGKAMSLADVADSLGFSSAPSFSRAFKRWTGRAPTDFRGDG